MAKNNFYAVKKGLQPGIYHTWDECKAQVHGFPGAIYKGFVTKEEAVAFIGGGVEAFCDKEDVPISLKVVDEPIAIDGAVAYVDGSYNVATGEYGCGVVFFYQGNEEHIVKKGEDSDLASMRNVAGEILGARVAMEKCVERGIDKLSIYHDYQGIASWCLGEWKTNKEGTKDYKAYYDSISSQVDIMFVKVKGHSSDKYNDLADELAKQSVME